MPGRLNGNVSNTKFNQDNIQSCLMLISMTDQLLPLTNFFLHNEVMLHSQEPAPKAFSVSSPCAHIFLKRILEILHPSEVRLKSNV